MAQEKYLSPAEKVELIKSQKSSVLLSAFESYARRNPIILPEEMELIRAELLIRLADASELEESPEKEITSEETQKPTESKSEPIKSIKELRKERERLAKIQWHEYTTRGNTERCQHLFKQILSIDDEIEALKEETK